jgi:hypothetical protein
MTQVIIISVSRIDSTGTRCLKLNERGEPLYEVLEATHDNKDFPKAGTRGTWSGIAKQYPATIGKAIHLLSISADYSSGKFHRH